MPVVKRPGKTMNPVRDLAKGSVGGSERECRSFERRRTQGMSSMMIVWMVAGIGTLLAGLAAIAYGILLDFSLGNSLIVAGTVAACTGLLLLALFVVVTELKTIARQLGDPQRAADARGRAGLPQLVPSSVPGQPAGDDAYPFSQDHAAAELRHAAPPAVPQGSPPPWHDASAPEPPPAPAAPAQKPKRNLLFESNLRKDRERPAPRVEPPVTADPQSAPPVPPPLTEAAETPPATFDDAWPKPGRAADRAPERASDRPRAPETQSQRRNVRSSHHAATNGSAAPRPEEPPAVTVLKSGVVDGMAYSLYSDGSIEAQMPEGMMRFASIDELRAHLDQR